MPLTYRSAVKLIRARGGVFTGHGREHDEFTIPWGEKVMIPRHRGDLSPGVESDIRKKVGGERQRRG